ncbi:MAG: late competence development ComFB family protein [Alicyclobacillus sp.]|nr:late competence development ComFB family protein [Alicyclobacillus sp.]
MAVFNVTEIMVRGSLEDAYVKPGRLRCSCPQCQDDILALALNRLPSHYVSTPRGSAFAKAKYFSSQLQSDVLRELAVAAAIVGERPRHPLPEAQSAEESQTGE